MGKLTERLLSSQPYQTIETGVTRPEIPPQARSGRLSQQLLSGPMISPGRFDPRAQRGLRTTPVYPSKPGTFASQFKEAFVDDPDTQIRIFAKARFPELPEREAIARYDITDKGEIVFQDDDGIFKRETPDTFLGQARKLGANFLANLPAVILGAIGATGGVKTAALGAGGGEAIRKLIGHLVFEEPQTSTGNALDIAIEGTLAGLGEAGGNIFSWSINKTLGIGRPSGRKLSKLASKDLRIATKAEKKLMRGQSRGVVAPVIDEAEMNRMIDLGKKYGIDLNVAEVAGSRELINRFNLLADLSQSADLIDQFKKTQNLQIQNAVPNFLRSLSEETDPFHVGKDITGAANRAIRGLKDKRSDIARPWYKKAFAGREDILVDTDDTIALINGMLGDVADKTPSSSALKKIRKTILDANGDIVVLDRIKQDTIDEILSKAKVSPNLRRQMVQVKRSLTGAMEKESPQYAQARFIHGVLSPEVEAAEKGLIGALSKMEGDNVVGAATQLLASKTTTPETIRRARRAITGKTFRQVRRDIRAAIGEEVEQLPEDTIQGKKVWNSAIAEFLRFRFSILKESQTSTVQNIGGAFRKAVFGNQEQREILRAAMTKEQFRNLSDFMEVLQKTGLTFGKESATATRQEELKSLGRETQSEFLTIATSPFRTPERTIADRINAVRFGAGARELAEKILDPKSGSELAKIKRLSPRSEQLIKQVSVFLAITAPETIETMQGIPEEKAKEVTQ